MSSTKLIPNRHTRRVKIKYFQDSDLAVGKMALMLTIITLSLFTGHVTGIMKSSPEKTLRDKLFSSAFYDKAIRPVVDHTKAVNVSFGLRLSKLSELVWFNPYLAWNESEYQGIHTLHVPAELMWVPDTVLYDNGDEEVSQAGFTEKFKTYVLLESSGRCQWMAPATFKSSCEIDITNFPFDSQKCALTFGSWTYDNRLVVLKQLHDKPITADKYVANGDWTVRNTTIQNRVMQYSCCQHPFSDVTYTFILDRKPAYHVLYLIVPCIIISCLSMLTFFLPPDCGERVGLSITLVLAMAVYLLIVSDILPETSDYVPRLGLYYMVIMGELALVVAANAVVLRCHFSRSKPPTFIKRFSRTHKQQITIVKPLRAKIKSVNESVNTTPNSKEQLQEEVEEDEDIETWPEYWKDFACRLDFVFLGSFALLFLVSTLCTLFVRKTYAL